MFFKGWLELVGYGQFIYKYLVLWVGFKYEGYWCDLDYLDCLYGNDWNWCMMYYKDLLVGINVIIVFNWLRSVIISFSFN